MFCGLLSGHRIDAEASSLQKKLEGMKASSEALNKGEEKTSEKTTDATLEVSIHFCLIVFVSL